MNKETTPNLSFGLGIAVHHLITEEELKPIAAELKEKGIELKFQYFNRGVQASLDWLNPVVALYGSSEMFRSLIQSGLYDVFKIYLITIIKTVASRKYLTLTSNTTEEKKGAIAIVVSTKDKATATYSFEGVISESVLKYSLDAFERSVNSLNPDSNKQNMIHATFCTETNEWKTQTMSQFNEEIRKSKENKQDTTL